MGGPLLFQKNDILFGRDNVLFFDYAQTNPFKVKMNWIYNFNISNLYFSG